ncbi:hypothetical protein BDV97DRAFT_191752 [Delphinella strobiligena]|nr:hypothetical protein BDV97DRAFT_191752 [Delphinella strobiligena]
MSSTTTSTTMPPLPTTLPGLATFFTAYFLLVAKNIIIFSLSAALLSGIIIAIFRLSDLRCSIPDVKSLAYVLAFLSNLVHLTLTLVFGLDIKSPDPPKGPIPPRAPTFLWAITWSLAIILVGVAGISVPALIVLRVLRLCGYVKDVQKVDVKTDLKPE